LLTLSPQPSSGPAGVRAALEEGRAALLAVAEGRAAPQRLVLPLLAYALPLLEAQPPVLPEAPPPSPVFSSADVAALLSWAAEAARRVAAGGGWAAGGGSQPWAALAAAAGLPQRVGADVAAALVRAAARSHALENSRGGATDAGTAAPAARAAAPLPFASLPASLRAQDLTASAPATQWLASRA
jgi:hypothetical protein